MKADTETKNIQGLNSKDAFKAYPECASLDQAVVADTSKGWSRFDLLKSRWNKRLSKMAGYFSTIRNFILSVYV